MKSAKIALDVITILVTAPIWFYLLYQILVRVEASELMFFLYWIYLPVGLLGQILKAIVTGGESES